MPGLWRRTAAVALGTAGLNTREEADPVLDAYVEAGGDLLDTAWIYEFGQCERVFGAWLAERGIRDQVTLIVKGAHTPHCDPASIGTQLEQSLDRLGIERADIYMMHRDNADHPVAELVDAILEQVTAGRVAAYGFSNWSIDRVDAAITHALGRDALPACAVSNNFSLAEMLEPVWEGCVAARDPRWAERLRRGDLGLYAWSSQARGFFAGREGEEIERCWRNPRNDERLVRARQLAEQRHTDANTIALAWCLAQELPVIPLIGPLNERELAASLSALDLELSQGEVTWLDAADI